MRVLSTLLVLALVAVALLGYCFWPVQVSSQSPAAGDAIGPPSGFGFHFIPGLAVGYISISLKRQLQRRGNSRGGWKDAFRDLISLSPPSAASTSEPDKSAGHDADDDRQVR